MEFHYYNEYEGPLLKSTTIMFMEFTVTTHFIIDKIYRIHKYYNTQIYKWI